MPKKGYKQTEKHREKLRQAKLGTKRPKEVCDKIRKNNSKYWLGKKRSKETIDKIKGKRAHQTISHSEETKRKIGESQKGKKIGLNARILLSLRQTGKKEFIDFQYNIKGYQRKTPEYKEWRKQIFKRDDYTCQDCGVKGCKLEAHHIKSFAKYEKLRVDINNGITYCVRCHCVNDDHRNKFIKQ